MTAPVRERIRSATASSAVTSAARSVLGRVIAVVTICAILTSVIIVWLTPLLGVRSVDVVSAAATTATAATATGSSPSREVVDAVRAAAAVPVGTPLVRVDLDALRARVAAVPSVASATVQRQWPHTVVISVVERVAAAATQANGAWWLLDKAGTPFRELDSAPDGLMPIQLATPKTGDRATLAALGVLHSLSSAVRSRVVGMSAATAYDVTLQLADGREVLWGSDADAAAKNAVIPALLREGGQVLDVSDPTLVTVRDAGDGGR